MQYLLVSSAMLRSFSSDGESESEVDVSWLGLRFFEEKKKSVVRTYIIESGKKGRTWRTEPRANLGTAPLYPTRK